MIISDKFRCIYIRIPKCASSSIEDFFIKEDNLCIRSGNRPPYGHIPASEVRKIAGEHRWNTYFKFTFIRDPYQWFVSQYKDNRKYYHPTHHKIHILLDHEHRLPDFTPEKQINLKMAYSLHGFLNLWMGYVSQNYYIDNDLDFIGIMEDLQGGWDFIKDKCNFTQDLQRINISNYGKITLTDQARKFVELFYEDDFKLYHEIKDDLAKKNK